METGCLEIVVKSRPDQKTKMLTALMAVLALVLAAGAVLSILSAGILPALVLAVGAASAVYGFVFFRSRCDLEFEYDYVDREIRVAGVYSKESRKDLASYDLNRMEILAPEHSRRLDGVRGRIQDLTDYSARVPVKEGVRWMLVLDKGEAVLLDLDPAGETQRQVLQLIRASAPRKVFFD